MSEPEQQSPDDIRPVVRISPGNHAPWLFGIGMAVAASLLFFALESRRANEAPAISATADGSGVVISSPPDLILPPPGLQQTDSNPAIAWSIRSPTVRPSSPPIPRSILPSTVPTPSAGSAPGFIPSTRNFPAYPQIGQQNPAAEANGADDRSPGANGREADGEQDGERVKATRFANPSTTVPKGTVIQAVLETALDSTRAGFARAIVTRDIFGFDGTQVLVPKGSRLIGEYKADLAAGQKRALIQWQRLMRPDGVMINIDSPAADPLGRAGVKGDVDTHFFERFSGAILQSTLDIGVQLATRRVARDTVILALPGSTQQAVSGLVPDKIQPTLKVDQGTSVSVFVARDLDFTAVSS